MRFFIAMTFAAAATAAGATGEAIYRDKCALCHDAGAGAVPGVREIENRLVSAALFEWD